MRELIRLLSSRLPVGKIPGIWEFILPLLYNSPPLSLSSSLLLPHSVPQNPSAITNQSLHLPSPLCAANHHLPSVFLCCALSPFTSHIQTHPLFQLLYYIPLRLIRLIASSTCNHIIRAFFQSSLLQPSHLLPCLLHAYFLLV